MISRQFPYINCFSENWKTFPRPFLLFCRFRIWLETRVVEISVGSVCAGSIWAKEVSQMALSTEVSPDLSPSSGL